MDKHKSQKLLRPSKEIRKVKRELVAESQRIAIEALCKILGQCKDENTIMVSLNALEDMLKIGAQIAAEGTINVEVLFSNIRFENIRIYSNILTFEVAL